MRRRWLVLFALALLCPGARAVAVSLDVFSDSALALEGVSEIALTGGSGRVRSLSASGIALIHLETARVAIHTGEVAAAPTVGIDNVPMRPDEVRNHTVRNATLTLTLDAETLIATIALQEGVLHVRGMTQATGRPVFLDAPEGRQDEGTLPTLHTPPEKVDFQWEEGWFFLGSYETTIHHEGFPRVDGAHLDARGIGAIELFGGTLEFTDGDGRQQRVELGEERHAGPAGVEALGTRVLRSAYIEGVVAWTQVPLGEEWGFAAPAIRMEIDGDARWEAATGRVRVADAWHDIERAPLHIRGETRVVIQRTGAGLLDDPASYAGDAEASYVRVGGQVATGDTTGPAAAAKLGLAALLLALLTLTTSAAADLAARVLVPLYSRLSRADVLNHPTRAAIREIVTAEPGIHLRELHRIVGGAWGPFSFHVRMMEKMGAIELRREGRYVAATAPGLARAPDVPRADVQRRIIAGLAARDGAAERAALEAELRVSRQLLRYHLRRLLADGRVREEGGRIVLAAPGHATDPQTFAPVDS